jgi:protein-S-isoprenylcysteine O-methyltransferase Ste14
MALRLALIGTVEILGLAALLFGGAGTLRWPAGWAYLILFVAGSAWITAGLARRDPALLAERMKLPMQKGQPLWDKALFPILMVAFVGWEALMGMDAVRFHWSAMPEWLQWAGGALSVASFLVMDRTTRENPFLATVVRIQTEREQRVISSGPYAVVRHPLYAAATIYLPASALLLGSWYGLAGSALLLAAVVFRTAMEDRELRRGLEGYTEYAMRVRWRLVPFLW